MAKPPRRCFLGGIAARTPEEGACLLRTGTHEVPQREAYVRPTPSLQRPRGRPGRMFREKSGFPALLYKPVSRHRAHVIEKPDMSNHVNVSEREERLIGALQGALPHKRTSLRYRAALSLQALIVVLLPLLYLSLVAFCSWGVYWYAVHSKEWIPKIENKADVAASFEEAVVDVLVTQTLRAAESVGPSVGLGSPIST